MKGDGDTVQTAAPQLHMGFPLDLHRVAWLGGVERMCPADLPPLKARVSFGYHSAPGTRENVPSLFVSLACNWLGSWCSHTPRTLRSPRCGIAVCPHVQTAGFPVGNFMEQ